MILKVGCAQVHGPSHDTNLHECLALGVLGQRSDPSRSRSIRFCDQQLAQRLPGRMAARSLSVVYPELVMLRGCLSEDVVAGVRRLAEA
jgi:hypothetical protein